MKNLSFRSDVPQGIMLQLRWSKNIREERHAPTQVIFGSMDPQMCALLHLAVHCEQTFKRTVTGQESFLFGCGGKNLDNQARAIIAKALQLGEFETCADGALGTHSIRKGASTYAARVRAGEDDITNRGRWRTTTIVKRYISVDLPVPDAKMAVLLAGPRGACAYKVKSSVAEIASDEFILRDVAPAMAAVFWGEDGVGPGTRAALGVRGYALARPSCAA